MGAWGTAISSNDTYADIYDEFFDLYNEGRDVKEISEKLIADNKETIENPDDCNNFWFALAKAQWECKQLDTLVFEKVKSIITSGIDIEVWRVLDADEEDLKKRKLHLDKFLLTLQTERPKAKPRKKKIIRQPVFETGECLTFKLVNGNYGGAVVLAAVSDTEYGLNLIATTRINQTNKPTNEDFKNAEVLIANFENFKDDLRVMWYMPTKHKQVAHLIESVGKIEVQHTYSFDANNRMGLFADFDSWVIKQIDNQYKSEKTKPPPKIKKTVKELTKKKWWKFL